MTDIFKNTTSKVPRSDGRIIRVPFDKEDIGARKAQLSRISVGNDNSIQHVSGSSPKGNG